MENKNYDDDNDDDDDVQRECVNGNRNMYDHHRLVINNDVNINDENMEEECHNEENNVYGENTEEEYYNEENYVYVNNEQGRLNL